MTILKFYYFPLSRYIEQLYRVQKSETIEKLIIQTNKVPFLSSNRKFHNPRTQGSNSMFSPTAPLGAYRSSTTQNLPWTSTFKTTSPCTSNYKKCLQVGTALTLTTRLCVRSSHRSTRKTTRVSNQTIARTKYTRST